MLQRHPSFGCAPSLAKGEVLLPKAEYWQLEPQSHMCRITSSWLRMGRAMMDAEGGRRICLGREL